MLKEWQFNVLFFVGVGGAVLLLVGPEIGFKISQNPTAVTGIGAILTYVLTQKKALTKKDEDAKDPKAKDKKDGAQEGPKDAVDKESVKEVPKVDFSKDDEEK